MDEEIRKLKQDLLLKAMKFANEVMDKLSGTFEDRLKISKIVLEKEKINHPIKNFKWTDNLCKLRFEVFKRDGFRCRYCGRSSENGVELRVDHVDPRSKGGTNDPENLVTACHECNAGKRDTLLTERALKKIMVC